MTLCPNCGHSVEPTAKVCPHCGAVQANDWPPPPKNGKCSVTLTPTTRLLTGRVWLDELIGMGLFWGLMFALNKILDHLTTQWIISVFRQRQPLPYYFPFVAVGVLMLITCAGSYLGLRLLFPKMARSFGQMTFWMLGTAILFTPLLVWWNH